MISPLNCIQELVEKDLHYPWRVLVVCTLLNQTHGRGVRPMIDEFFELVPTPEAMLHVDKYSIDHLLRPLGFHNRRFNTLCKMTKGYVHGLPPEDCFGVGPYARDSLMLFAWGRTNELQSDDTWLKPYREWRLAGGDPVQWDVAGYERWCDRNG